MKRRAKTNHAATAMPDRGDTFLMPLADGRYGVCRVIRRSTRAEAARDGESLLVAASPWVGTEPPDLVKERLREILVRTHHSWRNEPVVLWVSDPVPPSFERIGTLEPTPGEERMECRSFAGWPSLPLQVLLQWRWDNDREPLLKEDAERDERKARERAAAVEQRRRYLDGLTLETLRRKRWLRHWKENPSSKLITACRRNFRDTTKALSRLEPKPQRQDVLTLLKACIEQFNRLDAENGHFIDTIVREDLCEEFEEIVHAAGLGDCEDLADLWREW